MDKTDDVPEEPEINRHGEIEIPEGKFKFVVIDYVMIPQSNFPKKRIVLEDIKFQKGFPDERSQIRIRYCIIGWGGRMKGKWIHSRFHPFIPKKDLKKLIEKAKNKGIL